MAEVMTDNDHAVAKILESYEIAETGETGNDLENMILEGQVAERGEGTGDQSDKKSGSGHACELAEQSVVARLVKSKTSKKSGKKGYGLKKDVLTEIRNGRVAKKK